MAPQPVILSSSWVWAEESTAPGLARPAAALYRVLDSGMVTSSQPLGNLFTPLAICYAPRYGKGNAIAVVVIIIIAIIVTGAATPADESGLVNRLLSSLFFIRPPVTAIDPSSVCLCPLFATSVGVAGDGRSLSTLPRVFYGPDDESTHSNGGSRRRRRAHVGSTAACNA